MLGVRFYEDHGSRQGKKVGRKTGRVIAVFFNNPVKPGEIRKSTSEGTWFRALIPNGCEPNPEVKLDFISARTLKDNCKIVSAKKARRIHPKLFKCFG